MKWNVFSAASVTAQNSRDTDKIAVTKKQIMRRLNFFIAGIFAVSLIFATSSHAAENAVEFTNSISQPLSVADALNIALQQNAAILRGKADLEAAHGVILQTRAIAIPKVRIGGNYQLNDKGAIEAFPVNGGTNFTPVINNNESWMANIRVVQSIYEGGRINSALRTAKLTKEQAILNYQTVIADTLRDVRVAYDDVLLSEQNIVVQEASVNLLSKELEDTSRRLEAGTVPRFNQLRAEVEVANARPRLIRARNAYRIAKNNLANLLGYNLPKETGEDIPIRLSGKLSDEPYKIDLSDALSRAYENRTELASLRKTEKLRRENVVNAQGGYKPSVQVFGGYGSRSATFGTDLSRDISGWFTGVQLSWDIFDGLATRGRIIEARALHERAGIDVDDAARRIELQVRTAYSSFVEARELLESQKKVQEQAEEALRLAQARAEAGTGTQLDVLGAQTALTEARTTRIQALHDYSVAKTQLGRAIGDNLEIKTAAMSR
jgi:outer membrane protein